MVDEQKPFVRRTVTEDQVQRAFVDPANVFLDPTEVVNARGLSTECKIKILRRWDWQLCIDWAPRLTLNTRRPPNMVAYGLLI